MASAPLLPTVAVIFSLLPVGSCFDLASPASPDSSFAPSANAGHDTELALCVSITNTYRASTGRGALTRAARLDTYAAEAARSDASARQAHHYTTTTNFGNGLVRAENELLWWPLSTYGTVENVVREGLSTMWKEGPGGTHYVNMVGNYSEIGCGIYVTGGEATVEQAFR
jgi:uncharacterized protein YkwD